MTGYKIFRNGSQVGTSSTTSFSDTGLTASTTYTYAVSAYDAAGNNSPTSPPATATTSAPSFDFALSNGGNRSVARGSSIDNAITATLVSGATQNVVFSTSGLPAGATASYAPSSCSPGCATTITIATTAATPLATSTITVTGTAGSLVRTTTFSLTVTLPVDTTAPTVALGASPASGSTVSGTVTLSATASDNVGIAGVTFKVDGVDIGTEDTSSPYAVSLNTATLSNGSHTLTAVARDTSNNSATSAPVVVTVDNTTPPSTMIRYVNTASTAGGDGTTNDTSGATRAFRSLLDAINSLPDVLTMPVVIYGDGAAGLIRLPVDQGPFDMVTSAANYILITTNASNRAKVPHDPARYTLAATNSNVLYNNLPSHIRFDGLQVQLTITDGEQLRGREDQQRESAGHRHRRAHQQQRRQVRRDERQCDWRPHPVPDRRRGRKLRRLQLGRVRLHHRFRQRFRWRGVRQHHGVQQRFRVCR